MSKNKQILCRYCNEPIQNEYIITDDYGGKVKFTKSNIINLNKKIYGRYQIEFLCLNCMCEDLEMNEFDLYGKMEQFKEQGCKLF